MPNSSRPASALSSRYCFHCGWSLCDQCEDCRNPHCHECHCPSGLDARRAEQQTSDHFRLNKCHLPGCEHYDKEPPIEKQHSPTA